MLCRLAQRENMALEVILEYLICACGEQETVEEVLLGETRLCQPCEEAVGDLVEAQKEVRLGRWLRRSADDCPVTSPSAQNPGGRLEIPARGEELLCFGALARGAANRGLGKR